MRAGPEIRFAITFAALVALACWLTSGCGPIRYVNQVTRKASAAVAAAEAAKADKYSPYWYTLAVEYLRKAREEASFADYEAANRFGLEAQKAADKAKEESIARAGNPADTDWLPPPSLREADDKGADDGAEDGAADRPIPADSGSGLAPVINNSSNSSGDRSRKNGSGDGSGKSSGERPKKPDRKGARDTGLPSGEWLDSGSR